ncbi:hypothetical protein KPATCC21470_6523 [Kitasatospora purpeofusca]
MTMWKGIPRQTRPGNRKIWCGHAYGNAHGEFRRPTGFAWVQAAGFRGVQLRRISTTPAGFARGAAGRMVRVRTTDRGANDDADTTCRSTGKKRLRAPPPRSLEVEFIYFQRSGQACRSPSSDPRPVPQRAKVCFECMEKQ